MTTLYRKYRPQNFQEIVGQNHIKLTLKHEISSGKIAHAYIFCGPRAVGKTTLARVFAKAVNCLNNGDKDAEPCDKCENCQAISSGHSIDVIEIDAASNTGVDNVRENIIASARISPVRSKFKVFIIDEVHMLSLSSFNALLKILEEPPANVIFILCTTEMHKVPATIISRCQRFDFKKISVVDMVKKLNYIASEEKISIAPKIIEEIARQSAGYMRDAESLLGQIVGICDEADKSGRRVVNEENANLVIPRSNIHEALNLLDLIIKKDTAASIILVNKAIDDGIEMKTFLNDFIDLSRKIILNKISPNIGDKFGLDLGESFEAKSIKIAANVEIIRLTEIVQRMNQALLELKNYFIPQLAIEIAIVDLCSTTVSIEKKSLESKLVKSDTVVKEESPAQIETAIFSWDEIKSKWDDVLVKIRKYNHSLSFILKVCIPRSLENNQLKLAFKYKFHKDRVDDPQIKQIIEKTLVEVYGLPLSYAAIIDETIEIGENETTPATFRSIEAKDNSENNGTDNLMNNLLKTFGGKIIS